MRFSFASVRMLRNSCRPHSGASRARKKEWERTLSHTKNAVKQDVMPAGVWLLLKDLEDPAMMASTIFTSHHSEKQGRRHN